MGTLPTWEITVELFEYGNEKINTGIGEIDRIQTTFSLNVFDYSLVDEDGDRMLDESGNYLVLESYDPADINPASDNEAIQDGTDNFPLGSKDFIDFSERNPFAEDNY
jgi:hypothetical protein